MPQIKHNIAAVKDKIRFYCEKHNRNPNDIELVAVSKFHSAAAIEQAYACGIRDFGENYVQEWLEKKTQLAHLPDIRWHLIGHLQSNKAKHIDNSVYCLQSLDSLSLAKSIEAKHNRDFKLPVLVQLTVDPADENKTGMSFEHATALCHWLSNTSQSLQLKGFMGIGPAHALPQDLAILYTSFVSHAQLIWKTTAQQHVPSLSFGMSDDLETAIACGSTMVRIGTHIFGERSNAKHQKLE